MKKLLTLLTAIAIFSVSFATSVVEIKPVLRADQIFIPTNKTGGKISLMELSRIKIKDFEILRGQKMKFIDRLTFKAAQKKVRDNINNDGTINSKKLNKFFKKSGESGFHIGGFALGFLLGLIGVLIAYLINDDYKRNRVKWAWIGLGAWIAILLVIIAAGGFAVY
jgi:hypothetical protein